MGITLVRVPIARSDVDWSPSRRNNPFAYGTLLGQPVTDAQGGYFYPFLALPLLTIDCFRGETQVPHSARWIIAGSVVMLSWLVIKILVHDHNL